MTKQAKENTKNDFSTQGNQRKTGLEQHYTTPMIAEFCTQKFFDLVDSRDAGMVLEPCAGTGEFSRQILKFTDYLDEMDIDPKIGMRRGDFLDFNFYGGMAFSVITNPPFGRGNSLSVKFFNHAASAKANYIGFLIPASWRKWSLQNKLDKNYHLIGDFDLPAGTHFYELGVEDNKETTLSCVFQVWEWRKEERERVIVPDNGFVIKSTPEEADIQLVTNGWSLGKVNIDFDRGKKVNGTRYYKLGKEGVLNTLLNLKETDAYSKFTKNNAYVKSISFDELNYLLNERMHSN